MSEKREKIVVALGGNALQEAGMPPTAESQLAVARKTCEHLAEMCEAGYQMAIVHGNGPQVGMIVLSQETAAKADPKLAAMPFDVCGAMSQGYIGYHIQQSLRDALAKRGIYTPVVSLLTQVVVNGDDPAFQNPTKPIGPYYTADEAKRVSAEKGYVMKEDSAGRGWRRVVASPKPVRIAELDSVKRLWDSSIVITAGGGGIPVTENAEGAFEGVSAVIDKDYAADRLAEDIGADKLMILTEVDCAYIDFKTPGQRPLREISLAEARKYVEEGHFAAGSMLPKIKASIEFAEHTGNEAIITSLYKANEALRGEAGTVIRP